MTIFWKSLEADAVDRIAIIIDELQNALSRQKITVETGHNNLIVYTDATEKWAIALAKDFREKGKYMEL